MLDLRRQDLDAASVARALDLRPHPEGGFYRETWRASGRASGRAPGRAPGRASGREPERGAATAILFLLDGASAWHRVDAAELWLWHAGASLELAIGRARHRLGPLVAEGERLQWLVAAGEWQAARTAGAWTLVSCVVVPAFEFAGFEVAPPGFAP